MNPGPQAHQVGALPLSSPVTFFFSCMHPYLIMLCADAFFSMFGEAVWNLESAFCILYDKGKGETPWTPHSRG